ncbi:MAG: hypothetical protein A3J76_06085 [Candidatus Moranbacteria bacterium RBG_13_45_13]|nr:MAG: hypothetical protein A3J76_06085 [Candidatus Moranbacteria bacterium RBG_13_45_13]
MYNRIAKLGVKNDFFKGKVVILAGARQTGKTTLAGEIISGFKLETRHFNCDNPSDRELLTNKDLEFLKNLVGNAKIVFIDEGQKVLTIGQTLKLLVDHFGKTKQILVTGSSSFNLLYETEEALTGRKFVYYLFPLSLEELHPNRNLMDALKSLEQYLIFGNYPEIASLSSAEEKKNRLREFSASYLYQDILEFQQVKSSSLILNLLKALALQIGSEVSYTELGSLLDINKKTVERYVDLLEKNFIIFKLGSYFTNKRKEISKMKKIYFWDLGIRNAIINNFNFLASRADKGALWENFAIAERLKFQSYHRVFANNYFFRTYAGSEVDLIEEREGKLFGYEMKWDGKRKEKIPAPWAAYSNSSWRLVTPEKILDFIL